MCGLVGLVTKNRNGFSSANVDLFESLLFMDQLRGNDSTGTFLVNNVGNVSIAKAATNSTDFLPTEAWKDMRREGIQRGWALIGHNRKATRGNVTDENAHPFWVDDKVVLVHNGTMYGDHKKHADVEVDSNAIAHILAEEENVEVAMRKVNAAYALIWYHVQKKQLNILRNDQRPLHWGETDDAYFFASEADMMVYCAKRMNVQLLNNGPFTFEANEHDVWSLGDNKLATVTTTKLDCSYRFAATPPVVSAPNFPGEETYPLADRFSCGYWGSDEGCAEPAELTRLREVGREMAQAAIEEARSREAPKLVLVETKEPPSLETMPKFTFGEWEQVKKAYPDGCKIKVECKDYIPDDAGVGNVFMIGQTTDQNKIHVIFPIAMEMFKAIMDPHSEEGKEKRAVFFVEVNGCRWRKAGAEAPKHSDTQGWVTLAGKAGAKLVQHAGTQVQ